MLETLTQLEILSAVYLVCLCDQSAAASRIFYPTVTSNFDLLSSKSEAFIFVQKCISDVGLVIICLILFKSPC